MFGMGSGGERTIAVWGGGVGRWGLFSLLLLATFWLDGLVRGLMRSLHSPAFAAVAAVLTRTGDTRIILAVAAALFLAGLGTGDARYKAAGGLGVVSVLLVNGLAQLLKFLIGRPRPVVMDDVGFRLGPVWEPGFDAFPSGHAVTAFAFAAVLSATVPGGRWLWYGYAFVVAWTRLYLDLHFLSDVVAGGLLGLYLARRVIGWLGGPPLLRQGG